MAFLLFSIFFVGIFYLHFAVAHRAWQQIRGRQSAELDLLYVRIEDYFGQSFRAKLAEWIRTLPLAAGSTSRLRVIAKGAEQIFIAGAAIYPAGRTESAILVIEGNFQCGVECEFEKELMVKGDCVIGDETELQAVAADGTLLLGAGSRVHRWADAVGHLTLSPDAIVASRVTSRTSVEFLPGATAQSIFAPEVFTEGRHESDVRIAQEAESIVHVPHSGSQDEPAHGYDPAKLFAMGGDTYLYDGDLQVTAPMHLRKAMVVRGNFSCPRESLLEADVKAHGTISIGGASVVKGNLVSGKDMRLQAHACFQGLLHAEGALRLGRGVRGLRDGIPVAAYSAGVMTVESNVVVNGKLSSAKRVIAISTPVAWLEGPRLSDDQGKE